jgi:hypothetical protein
MAKHDFMGEERSPFKGGGAVVVAAANQFVRAVRMSDELRLAELLNDVAGVALGDDMIQFHAATLAGSLGHPLSMLKIC